MKARASKTDFVARANACWPSPPDWIIALAEACAAHSQTAVAKRLAYSPSAISATLSNSYLGDVEGIAERVRGEFMAHRVDCPIKGSMSRNICLGWQAKPFAATSADRVRMFHACRSGCPHSRLKEA